MQMNHGPDRQDKSHAPPDPRTDDTRQTRLQGQPDAVYRFASQIVAMLAARNKVTETTVREALLLQLIEAVVSEDPTAGAELIARLRAHKISVEMLTDHYLPEAARALGLAWEADQADFVDVTIGAMRLQGILRGLDADDVITASQKPVVGSVLLIVPAGEQHTLGALVAASQIRRRGVSVCLRIMPRTNELRELLRNRIFDALWISLASAENLDLAGKLVTFLRKASAGRVPIVIGGALALGRGDLKAVTGADLATSDITAALAACGIEGGVPGARSLQARHG
jgi:methylmalonyl-CoA mutase cobalamin-binding subunit